VKENFLVHGILAATSALTLALALAVPVALAKPNKAADLAPSEAQALAMAKQLIALRTVRGPGNKTAEAMQLVRRQLLAAGWSDSAVEIVPLDDTA
jgi:carboxypeptidase PM20D1